MKKAKIDPSDYIIPLNMNGLQGRMLHLPAPKNCTQEILFVYGHHSSLERWWGLMLNLNQYAAVTTPDLPGFGGMDSFYKIGEEATIDNLADYMAAFIKMRYKRRKVIVAGMSLGFVIVTRMLQRFPELSKNITIVISIAGFMHQKDFLFSPMRRNGYLLGARFFSLPGTSSFFRHVLLAPPILRSVYKRTHNAKEKFKGVVGDELEQITQFEIKLWHDNDVRTYMKTTSEFLALDNTKIRIDMPVYHVAVAGDRYFDNRSVEEHMRMVYNEFNLVAALEVGNHAPSVIADAKAAAPYVPLGLRALLKQFDKRTAKR